MAAGQKIRNCVDVIFSMGLIRLPLLNYRAAGPPSQLQPGEPNAGQPADRLRAGIQLRAAPRVPHGGE